MEKLDNDQQTIIVPSIVSQKEKYARGKDIPEKIDVVQENLEMSLQVKKAVPYIVLPNTIGAIIVVSDSFVR